MTVHGQCVLNDTVTVHGQCVLNDTVTVHGQCVLSDTVTVHGQCVVGLDIRWGCAARMFPCHLLFATLGLI